MVQKKGFTLIELLVVIGIIVFLFVLGVIALGSVRQMARDSIRLDNLRMIQANLERYFSENNAYPVVASPGVMLGDPAVSCLSSAGFGSRGCQNPYIDVLPKDPGSGKYVYISEDGSSYTINAQLEGEVNGLKGQIRVTPSGIQ